MARPRFFVAATFGVTVMGAIAVACGLELTGTGSDLDADGAARVAEAGPDDVFVEAGAGEIAPAEAGADTAAEAAPAADAGHDADCVARHSPSMLRVGSVCIDVTEVTNEDYRAFLAAPDQPPLTPECAWNTSYLPDGGQPPQDSFPVYVSWCNAQAYCAWAGKRLCGKLGGGSLSDDNDVEDPTKGQWVEACSNSGAVNYPYGDDYDGGACGAAAIRPVGALTTCQGPVMGLFDMSGNAWEWVDGCNTNGAGGPQDDCAIMGGAFSTTDQNQLKCRAHQSGKRGDVPFGVTGFRCCSP